MAALLADNVKRITVVMPSWVGDTVMATPVLRAVKQHRPGAAIAAVVRPGLEQLLAGCPWLVSCAPCHMKGSLGVFRLASAIRGQQPDAVLLLPNSFRSALAARVSGTPQRIGYTRDGRGFLLSHRVVLEKHAKPVSTVLYYRQLAGAVLGVDDEAIDPTLELHTTDAENAAADELLRDVDASMRLVLLNPGGVRGNKRWPAERFARVADALAAEKCVQCAVTGAPSERDVIDEVVNAARTPIVNLAARSVTLGSLKSVLKRAALLISNDTGPRHIAAALGTPCVALFGPTDHRWTSLRGARERILLAEPFLPGDLIADQHAAMCAIDRIRVGDVIAAAGEMLGASRDVNARQMNDRPRAEPAG